LFPSCILCWYWICFPIHITSIVLKCSCPYMMVMMMMVTTIITLLLFYYYCCCCYCIITVIFPLCLGQKCCEMLKAEKHMEVCQFYNFIFTRISACVWCEFYALSLREHNYQTVSVICRFYRTYLLISDAFIRHEAHYVHY